MTAPRRGTAPRRVRWLYHFTDFRSGLLLATLPLRDVRMSEVKGGAADGQGVVPLTDAVLRRDPFRATTPRRCVMWAERQEVERGGRVLDARVLWSGIVMRRSRKRSARAMTLGMVTWESYFKQRIVGDATHTQVDKHTIMRSLFVGGITQPAIAGTTYTDPHTATLADPVALGGVLADRTYTASALKPVLEAATELGNSGTGLDWRLVPYRDPGGQFRVRLDLGTPRLGRIAPPDVRWTDDDNDTRAGWLLDYTLTEDGSGTRNRVTALGEGNGPTQLRGVAVTGPTDRDEWAYGYPIYEGSLGSSTADDKTQDTVDSKARGALLAGMAAEVQLSGIKVRGDLAPQVTRYAVGDDGTFDLAATTTGQPTRIIGQIVGRTIEPAQRGSTETVTMDVQGRAS